VKNGTTMIELLVVLIILGLLGTLGAIGLVSLRSPPAAERLDRLRAARAEAIRTGVPVVILLDSIRVRFLSDGRVLGGPVDPLTGAWRDAR